MNKPIFFYSRNCALCTYFAENINIDWFTYFNMINIDNKKVRDKILSSKNIKINKVPCILTFKNVNNNIVIDKYEGEIAKQWILQNIINNTNNISPHLHHPTINVSSKENDKVLPLQKPNESKKIEKKIENKKSLKPILKKVNFDDSKNEQKEFTTNNNEDDEIVSFIDENELNILKAGKLDSTLKDRLNKQEEIDGNNSLLQKKKDVKGTSAVLHLARQMQTDRETEFKDGKDEENID